VLEHVTRRRIALPERGVEIALLDWGGEGPLALLHHANGFLAATWDLVAQRLREHFHVVGMDGRGHGDSSKPTGEGAYGWGHFGADLAGVARVLAAEAGGRIALGLGHSFGGTSMVLAAAEEPDLFERLILVDPPLPPPEELNELDPIRTERANDLVEGARKRRSVWDSREQARAAWSEKPLFEAWDPRAFDLYVAEGLADRPDGQVELKCRGEIEGAIFSQGFSFDLWSLAARVSTPTLVLWASGGNFPRALYEGFSKALGDARVADLAGGHLVVMEQPDLVVQAVLGFAGPDRG